MKNILFFACVMVAVILQLGFQEKPKPKTNIVKIYFDLNSDVPCDKSPEKKDYTSNKTITHIASQVINQSKMLYIRSYSGYDEDKRQELMNKRTKNVRELFHKAGVDPLNIIIELCGPQHIDLPVTKASVDAAKTEEQKEKLRSFNRFTEVKILPKK